MFYTKCNKCELGEYRDENDYKTVWGDGNTAAKIMLIGEAPGEQESLEGKPFVGRSGQLLRGILSEYFDLKKDLFITNTVCCRPPNNRNPLHDEQNKCFPYIYSQINTIKPSVIITAGRVSSDWMSKVIEKDYSIYKIKIVEWYGSDFAWLPVYHPAYLMRNRSKIEDFKKCIERYWDIFKIVLDKNRNMI